MRLQNASCSVFKLGLKVELVSLEIAGVCFFSLSNIMTRTGERVSQ